MDVRMNKKFLYKYGDVKKNGQVVHYHMYVIQR